MKKIISAILAVVMVTLSCSAGAQAISKDVELTDYPVVVVAGYTSAALVKENGDGTVDHVWGLDMNEVLALVLKRIARIGAGLGALTVGNSKLLADVVGKEVGTLLGDLRCNPDGSSAENVHPFVSTAEETNVALMTERFGGKDYQHETDILGLAATYIGSENIYDFNVDWRMGAVKCAEALDEYIQLVKAHSGKDKVNIFAVSHGGQITGTYLALYGEKQDVHNAVLTIPALGGSCLLYDILAEDVHLNELNLLYFIESGLMLENDFHWLVEAQELGFLDDVLNNLVPYLVDVAGYWGSIWDFCPSDIYEEMKAKWLDPVDSAVLIEESDYMHNTIIPGFSTSLQKCIDDYGINVSIIAGTDIDCTSGYEINGDGIIYTESSTGATCAPYFQRFADGYTQINDCGGEYMVSPAMTVDASTAYLKNNTWFVSGLFHGMTYWDMYTRELMMLLLLTDEIEDVHSNPDYPRFHESSNPSNAVWSKFNSSAEGYVSSDDTALLVKNVSEEGYTLRLSSVMCDGIDLDFDISGAKKIAAGETVSIPFNGEIPDISGKRVSLIFNYYVSGSLTPIGQRVMSFTVMNGESAEYGSDNPYSSAFAETPFDSSPFAFMSGLLKTLGLYNLVAMIYNMLCGIFSFLK